MKLNIPFFHSTQIQFECHIHLQWCEWWNGTLFIICILYDLFCPLYGSHTSFKLNFAMKINDSIFFHLWLDHHQIISIDKSHNISWSIVFLVDVASDPILITYKYSVEIRIIFLLFFEIDHWRLTTNFRLD